MSLTLLSWNLKGSKGVDVRAVVDHIEAMAADVVVLQEVQRRQARAIARSLGAVSQRWGFKHWPIRTWPEGMAVIGVTRPARVRTYAITHPWVLWSWRRRILQVYDFDLPSGTPWREPTRGYRLLVLDSRVNRVSSRAIRREPGARVLYESSGAVVIERR